MAERHDLHRHGLRVRRPADGAPLPGEGDRTGRGKEDVLRARAPAPAGRRASAAARGEAVRRPSRHRGRLRQADHRHAAPWQRHDPRRERYRRARGDEPLRRRPALAHLPPADHVALRDGARGRTPRAAGGGIHALSPGRRSARGVRGETHGLARGPGGLPGRCGCLPPFRRRRRQIGRRLHPDGPLLLRRPGDGSRSSPPGARGGRPVRTVDRAVDGLALSRCRAAALVDQGAGASARSVRTRLGGRSGVDHRGVRGVAGGRSQGRRGDRGARAL